MSPKSKIAKKVAILVAIVAVSPVFTVQAQEKDSSDNYFKLTMQFRPRLEIRDGQFRPLMSNERAAVLVSDRLRLTADYSYKNALTVRVSPQVVSVWGQAGMVQGAENIGSKFALYETWAKLKISPSWHTQVGRQVISLDDERFFGALDWAQGGRVHDAVSVHFQKNKWEVKGFFAYNQNYKTLYGNNLNNETGNAYSPIGAMPHKLMQTVWASFPIGAKNKITVLATNLGLQQATPTLKNAPEYYTQTVGANYFLKSQKVAVHVGGYFQGGKNIVGEKVEAYTATANMDLNLNEQWSLGVGSDWLSGKDVGTGQATRNNEFTSYFSTGHKFYGFMGYFHTGNGHKSTGISDSYLRVNFKTQKDFTASLVLHQFITPNKVVDMAKNYSGNLGQELDLTISYKINKFASVIGGYSFYATTETIRFLKGVPNAKLAQHWAWIALNITPTLFESKSK